MNKSILILSHNPVSDNNNMGKTIVGLFSEFENDNLAQLYLYPGYPSIDLCDSYYKITDLDMLQSFFGKKEYGKMIDFRLGQSNLLNNNVNKIGALYRIGKIKTPLIYLLRDLIWSKKHWFNRGLKHWLDNLNVSSVFYASGDSCFSYKMAIVISEYLNVPLITYFCDDFYFPSKSSLSPFYYFYKKRYNSYLEKTISISKKLIYISPSLESAYFNEFKKHGEVIYTPAPNILETKGSQHFNNPVVISYIGNVSLRFKSLLEIGDAIATINKNDRVVVLNIYSLDISKSMLKKIKLSKGINFKSPLNSNEVIEITMKSDIMVHAESFNKKMFRRIKYSISTKIPELLGLGKFIFAYGPADIASIEYLDKYNAAMICSNKNNLQESLMKAITDKDISSFYSDNALKLAKVNHNSTINSNKLKSIIASMDLGEK